MSVPADQLIEVAKIALDFAKSMLDAGKDPVAETRKRLVDVKPLVEDADADVDEAMRKRFG